MLVSWAWRCLWLRLGKQKNFSSMKLPPRVHNSGHWTEDACPVSQFEQHVRAIAGWPLGTPERAHDVEMENLIGRDVEAWPAILKEPSAHLTLYGKTEVRPGRKMGHVNRLKPKS